MQWCMVEPLPLGCLGLSKQGPVPSMKRNGSKKRLDVPLEKCTVPRLMGLGKAGLLFGISYEWRKYVWRLF